MISFLPSTSATWPMSIVDENNTNSVADPNNGGYENFVKSFDPRSDFSLNNPRNPYSKNYGAYSKQAVYNTYLS